MSYCINPDCPDPKNRVDKNQHNCCSCHSNLIFRGYQVVRLLNGSDNSQIYKIKKGIIVKVLKVTPAKEKNSRMANNTKREGDILKLLKHQGIPRVESDGYFSFKPNGSRKTLHCLIMEEFDGQNLEEWLSQNQAFKISEEQLLNWLKQLVKILSYLHEQGYIHRDIKPANIILRSNNQLGLVDFGSARKIDNNFALDLCNEENSTVTLCGSKGYTPPEQERGRPVQQSDFFALSRTIVHLITGINPIYLEEDNLGNCNWRVKAPLLSEFIASLLDDMMAYKPKERPSDTQTILQRLEGSTESVNKPQKLSHLLKAYTSIKTRKSSIVISIITSAIAISSWMISYQKANSSISTSSLSSTSEVPESLVSMCTNRSCIGRDPKDNACAPSEDVVRTLTSTLVNNEQQPRRTFRVELRYSPLCNSTWVRSWAPPGSFHYLQNVSGKEYGGAEVKNDSSLPHQFSDMGPGDDSLRACVRQPQGNTTCTNYVSTTSDISKL